jgi:hypothetical protein
VNGKLRRRVEHILVGHHLEAQTVEGVGSIGKQLPEEDLAVFIQGMDQDIEQLFGFCFEVKGLRFVSRGCLISIRHGSSS